MRAIRLQELPAKLRTHAQKKRRRGGIFAHVYPSFGWRPFSPAFLHRPHESNLPRISGLVVWCFKIIRQAA